MTNDPLEVQEHICVNPLCPVHATHPARPTTKPDYGTDSMNEKLMFEAGDSSPARAAIAKTKGA